MLYFSFVQGLNKPPSLKKKKCFWILGSVSSPSPLCTLPSLREHKHYLLVIIICGKVTRRDCFFHPRSLQSNKLLYRRLQQRKLLCVSLFSESRMLRRKRKRSSTECRRSPSVSVCQPYTNNCAVNCLILTSAFCLTVPRRCISSDVGMTCFGYCDFSASAHAIWSLSYTQATWEKTGT